MDYSFKIRTSEAPYTTAKKLEWITVVYLFTVTVIMYLAGAILRP